MKATLLTLLLLASGTWLKGQTTQRLFENYNRCLQGNNLTCAQKSLDSLLLIEPFNNYWLIRAAELYALHNNAEKANDYLAKAINNGFVFLNEIENNNSLSDIRSTSRYQKSIRDLETKLAIYQISETDPKILIRIPPLLECYVIMLYLGNSKHTLINTSKQNHWYFKQIDTYFQSFKRHPNVLALAKKYPSNDNDWINNLRAHHNLRTLYAFDTLNFKSIKRFPLEIDNNLAKQVYDFAVDTDFMKFYNANANFYAAMRKIIYTNYSFGFNLVDFFNQNFDMKINRFNVYLSPIYGGWQHGPTAKVGDYRECFYFGGLMDSSPNEFYYPTSSVLFSLLTEFDHTTVNALTDEFKGEIVKQNDKLTKLYPKGHVSYGSMSSTVNEYITWAFALQYFYEKAPAEYESLEKSIVQNMENGRGFAKFGEFMKFYKGYVTNRSKYPKLKDFYSEIINWIRNL